MTIVTLAFAGALHKHYDYLLEPTCGSRSKPQGCYNMTTVRFGYARRSVVYVVGTREVAALPTHVTATFSPLVNHTATSRRINR